MNMHDHGKRQGSVHGRLDGAARELGRWPLIERLQRASLAQALLNFGDVKVHEEIILVCMGKPLARRLHPERAFHLDGGIA